MNTRVVDQDFADVTGKMVAQCATAAAFLTWVGGSDTFVLVAEWGVWVTLVLTVASGAGSLWKARALLAAWLGDSGMLRLRGLARKELQTIRELGQMRKLRHVEGTDPGCSRALDVLMRGISDEQARQNCVACWKSVCDYAEEKQINIVLEMLNTRDRSHPMKGHPGCMAVPETKRVPAKR